TEGAGLDQLFVVGIAEAIEEENAQSQIIGLIQVGDGSADMVQRFLDANVVGRHATFEERQSRQRRQPDALAPAAIMSLIFFQIRYAPINGLVDLRLFLWGQPGGRLRLIRW